MESENPVDLYISGFPEKIREILYRLRATIRNAVPEAEEGMSYGMPCYKLKGPLVYFAGNKNHIGLYPTPSAIIHFSAELSGFKTSKGAIQFPFSLPIPFELVERIAKFKAAENLMKSNIKKQK